MSKPVRPHNIRRRLEMLKIVDETSGCWLYTGSRRGKYGQISYKHKQYSVHRLAAHIYLGMPLDSPLQANHKPICPNKHCFNPEHLYSGTQSQNILDILLTDKFPCGHSRIDANTYTYTSLQGKTYRWCKQCRNKSRRLKSANNR